MNAKVSNIIAVELGIVIVLLAWLAFSNLARSKQPENVPGPWYVDTTCTPCRVCLDEAPNLLKYNDDETYVYFYKQPENEEETAAAQRALDVCPTLAIGSDG